MKEKRIKKNKTESKEKSANDNNTNSINRNNTVLATEDRMILDLNTLIDTQQEELLLNYLLNHKDTITYSKLTLRRKLIFLELFSEFIVSENIEAHENIILLKIFKKFLDENSELQKLVEFKTLLKNLRNKLRNRCDLSTIYRLRGKLL